MLGSSMSIAGVNFILNTMVADVLNQFADELEKADDFDAAVNELLPSIRELSLTVMDTRMSGLLKQRNVVFQM